MPDLTFFDDPQVDRLAALVFELASQLHTERQRRAAIEELLVRDGVLDRAELEALADDEDFLADVRTDLDRSIDRLLRVVAEDGPARHPLRTEAADASPPA